MNYSSWSGLVPGSVVGPEWERPSADSQEGRAAARRWGACAGSLGRLLLGVLRALQLFASVCAAGLHKCTPLSKFITGLFLFIATGGTD